MATCTRRSRYGSDVRVKPAPCWRARAEASKAGSAVPRSGEAAGEVGAERPSGEVGAEQPSGEVGGPKGPEPTRFGDWERDGRCSDF